MKMLAMDETKKNHVFIWWSTVCVMVAGLPTTTSVIGYIETYMLSRGTIITALGRGTTTGRKQRKSLLGFRKTKKKKRIKRARDVQARVVVLGALFVATKSFHPLCIINGIFIMLVSFRF
ncbi:hypothetical protein BCR42DRAFT_409691, partial [Absidia repens]